MNYEQLQLPWENAPIVHRDWEDWSDQDWRQWHAAQEEDWQARNGE